MIRKGTDDPLARRCLPRPDVRRAGSWSKRRHLRNRCRRVGRRSAGRHRSADEWSPAGIDDDGTGRRVPVFRPCERHVPIDRVAERFLDRDTKRRRGGHVGCRGARDHDHAGQPERNRCRQRDEDREPTGGRARDDDRADEPGAGDLAGADLRRRAPKSAGPQCHSAVRARHQRDEPSGDVDALELSARAARRPIGVSRLLRHRIVGPAADEHERDQEKSFAVRPPPSGAPTRSPASSTSLPSRRAKRPARRCRSPAAS